MIEAINQDNQRVGEQQSLGGFGKFLNIGFVASKTYLEAERMYKCKICGKEFPSKKGLSNHRRIQNDIFRKKFKESCSNALRKYYKKNPNQKGRHDKIRRTKRRLSREGKLKSWSKGLTKKTDERLKQFSIILIGHKYNGKKCPKCGRIHKDKTGVNNCNNKSGVLRKKSKAIKNFYKNHPEVKRTRVKKFKEWCKNHPDAFKGENNGNYGKKWSEEKRLKRYGKGNPSWKGGKSYEPYTKDFNNLLKIKIRKKFKNKCFLTEKISKVLMIHHINYIKEDCREINLIPLSISSHGKTGSNRDYWFALFCYYLGIEPEDQLGGAIC